MTIAEHADVAAADVSLWKERKFQWLLLGVAFVVILEGLALFGWRLPEPLAPLLLGTLILVVGHQTILHGAQSLLRLDFRSIKALMVIAVTGAFFLGEYEEASVVIVLFNLSERLEEFGIERSRSALQALVSRTPRTAAVAGKAEEIPVTEVEIGDVVIVKPAEMIPVDGEVVVGTSSVDEASITGEPLPKDKQPRDSVFAGTLNLQGYLEVRTTKKSQDSTLSKILALTFGASAAKAETQILIERFSRLYTPTVIALSVLLVLVPVVLLGQPFEVWFREALTLLVIACPCALVISTPISMYAAIGNASRRGAIIKGGKYVEALGRVRAVAMDKTRTITFGRPKVTDVLPWGESSREHLLSCAAGIESFSEHPLAKSVMDAAQAEQLQFHRVQNFQSVLGKGAKAECLVCYSGEHLIGKLPFIQESMDIPREVVEQVEDLQRRGRTSIVLATEGLVEGVIGVMDEIKPDSAASIAELGRLDIEVVMLTGDHSLPAKAVADVVGIAEVRAGMLPEDKAEAIGDLTRRYGHVAMVGDGVNDAPALALSAVGISMGNAGSDVAMESSAIVILNDRLEVVPFLVRLGRRAITTIKLNTAVALVTKLLFVALALAGWSSLAGAIFADVGVTVLVILNSLRLMSFR
jgi:Cd2+/Zn2+-exporting ATPase